MSIFSPASAQVSKVDRIGIGGNSPSTTSSISVTPSSIPANTAGQNLVFIDGSGLFRKGLLAKGDLPAVTVYTDQANSFGAFLQTFGGTISVTGLSTLTGGFSAGANSSVTGTMTATTLTSTGATSVGTTLGVGGLSTLTGGFSAGANSSVTGTFGVSGLSTFTGGFNSNSASAVNAALTVTGLTTAAKIRTDGVYGTSAPFTVFASDGTTQRLLVDNAGKTTLTDTGTDSYLQYTATGATTGQRQWRAGLVGSQWRLQAGDDAGSTWTTLFRSTSTSGAANGLFWGTGVLDVTPDQPYSVRLGNPVNKYLSGSFAELNVSTLVAREEVVDINGRMLIGSGASELTAAINTSTTTISLKHNAADVGDILRMEARGQYEVMTVSAGPVAAGYTLAYKSSSAVAASTMTLPTHATGDLIVMVSIRNGSTTAPTLPAGVGWIEPAACTAGGNSTSYRVAYKVATSASEAAGTWTNATHLIAHVYSGGTSVAACASTSAASSTTVTYPALTMTDTDGSSWLMAVGFSSAASNVETVPPTSHTARATVGAGPEASSFDRANVTSSPTSQGVTVNASGNTRGLRLEITGGATGPYQYTVSRNDDGTGANSWEAGDAVFNTGQIGDGWWDIYAINSVRGGTELGPTLCANERTGTGHNAFASRACFGNLYGIFGNPASTLWGMAVGNPADVYLQIDSVNGVRAFEGGTNEKFRIDPTGYLQIGQSGSGQNNVYVDNSQLLFRVGTQQRIVVNSSQVQINDTGGTARVLADANGLRLGITASGNGNILADTTGNLILRSGVVNRIVMDAGNSTINIFDDDGVTPRVQIGATDASFGGNSGARINLNYSLARMQMYDGSNNLRLWADAANGLVLGPGSNGSGKPYAQLTDTALLFCEDGGGCTFSINGATGDLNLAGKLTVGSGGSISSGATGYGTGIGYWLDYNGGSPRFYVGNGTGSSDKYLSYSSGALTIQGSFFALGGMSVVTNDGSGNSINGPSGGNFRLASNGVSGTITLLSSGGITLSTTGSISVSANGSSGTGFTGTKVAGACTFSMVGGIVTGVTGC